MEETKSQQEYRLPKSQLKNLNKDGLVETILKIQDIDAVEISSKIDHLRIRKLVTKKGIHH